MSKRNGQKMFSRKKLFPSAARITNSEGKRVWELNGKEYKSSREMLNFVVEEAKKVIKK